MKLLDVLIDELNDQLTEEQKKTGKKFERLHSEQYQIVDTEDGRFYNRINNSERK